ncbi:MAG: SDR family NAD(P)-dependent oxidoreductase [Bacilli bacterium]|jgi:NAD(P)-dependent dehydrogenase (short-subunit alcohol dehydrogenase family)|uniref:SDR family oxidoreductase n=2 Tax=Ureibacillus TaxID=160795 RepID=A0A540V3G0_9BACL|nr:SDR family NAD(P)-dependent oxidoreductase [Ureibacillus terrenus]MBO2504309.1 short-chain dehydrogenase [Bacilli bacterium]TQE91281.1 SDR family oxidoreductase [Ureibacillus terrenus]
MGKLTGKVAIITGGASGIGAATAKLFVEEGAKVVIVDVNEEKGKAFEEELKNQGGEALFVQADVTNEEDVQNVFAKAKASFGKVDILFNNAGIGAVKPTDELPFSEWRKTIAVDLDGVFLFARAAIKEYLQSGGGVIVNTASMYGLVGAAGSAAYNAAKAGVVNFTRSIALEYANRNIRINAICPGFIDTPILGDTDRNGLIEATPMKRLGKPEEIAKAVLFLASDDSSFMTGSALVVDGGYTAQ